MHHRIYVEQPIESEEVTISGAEFHHAARVVRVVEGEEVELFDIRGRTVTARVIAAANGQLRLRIERDIPSRESPIAVTLAMSIIQLEKFELVLQKATELGVRAIIPMVTDRVEIRAERYRGKHDRWEKIIFEAIKQSGRSSIAKLEAPRPFSEIVAGNGTIIMFDADSEPSALPAALDSATLLIGPEGGWSDEELAAARQHHCLFRRLGPRRLRAETAAIVAAGIITAQYGDI